jgi:hypothetical protein
MDGLIADGLVTGDGSRLFANEARLLLALLTAACFDAYRVVAPGKHAVAI